MVKEVYKNAIASIKIGLLDYESGSEDRLIGAVRNFYSGVLLLGKQCLLNKVPDVDPMNVLAAKFTPKIDEHGKLIYEPEGQGTINLSELKRRFKSFGLKWPDVKIEPLQKMRNNFEHYQSDASKEAIRETIAKCFPMVEGFFHILNKTPSDELGDVWNIMLSEKSFYSAVKVECDQSFSRMDFYVGLNHSDEIRCDNCGSSLIYQHNHENADPESIDGCCRACNKNFAAAKTVEMILSGEYWAESHIAIKGGCEGPVSHCPDCGWDTYVWHDTCNKCVFCEYEVTGECAGCGDGLNVSNQSADAPGLCSYCNYKISKCD